jgi:hypothetical protein
MIENWNIGILEEWNTGGLEYWKSGILIFNGLKSG